MATTYPRDDSSFTHYTRMARYYDIIYSKILDYSSQADYLERIIAKHKDQKRPGSILDVACGTGNYTFIFAERGWKATGIDISNEMIRIATEKAAKKTNPRFLLMDMRKIELQEKYDVATVLFGGFGYLLEHEEVENFLAGVEILWIVDPFRRTVTVYTAPDSSTTLGETDALDGMPTHAIREFQGGYRFVDL